MAEIDGQIEYTPEQLQEIERIIAFVTDQEKISHEPVQEERAVSGAEIPAEDIYRGEPEDLDLPTGDLDGLSIEDFPEKKVSKEFSPEEDISTGEIPAAEASVEDELSGFDIDAEPQVKKEPAGETVEDITDLVRDIEEPVSAEDMFAEGEIQGETTTDKGAAKKPRSPLEELEALTDGEPESLEFADLAEKTVGEKTGMKEAEPSFEDMDLGDLAASAEPSKTEGVSLDRTSDTDIPDLSDISLSEPANVKEADTSDIPDIDFSDIGMAEEKPAGTVVEEELPEPAIEPEPEMESVPEPAAKKGKAPSGIDDVESFHMDDFDIDAETSSAGRGPAEESLIIEPLDEEEEVRPLKKNKKEKAAPAEEPGEPGEEISDRDFRRLKKAILLFSPPVVHSIRDTIINDRLPGEDTRKLVAMILDGKSENAVRKFLEKKLKITIAAGGARGNKILASRPEYTREGMERQKRVLDFTRKAIIAAGITFLSTILLYQYVYKPIMAKHTIKKGVALIMTPGDYAETARNFTEAERLFDYSEDNYKKDYIWGYNAYGRAYIDRREPKEYMRALRKFDAAFKIAPRSILTLNNLGYLYSRMPDSVYRLIPADEIKKYYREGEEWESKSQLLVSIDFFRRVLVLDKENIDAMVGIGNAYFYQGQYEKARKYYEDILKVDRKSVVGHAGLLNLYIETDNFPKVTQIHFRARDLKILPELPSALLAKLAGYYLDKRRSDKTNVRIDYGVQSPRLVDDEDNTDPAVESVLKALNQKDPEYPPLQYQYARFARVNNNLKVMERHLEKAIKLEPNYFAALHLLGEYYYDTRDPVKAYQNLDKATKAWNNPPEFTQDPFYKETEEIGHTYAVMGNIFYYFFDKVRFNYGSLGDETVDEDMEKLANYGIAREKYETAVKAKYESPELWYNLGRIYYLNQDYGAALDQWGHLYEDFARNPQIMFALGNAFYHVGNIDAARGEYLKLSSVFEYEAERIRRPDPIQQNHTMIYETLSATYNNLGAIYQKLDRFDRSSISYWKSIEFAGRLGGDNEFARVNLARSYREDKRIEPILDENIPYSLPYYREDMRK